MVLLGECLLTSESCLVCVAFVALDASRTWICYWILHSLSLLDNLSGLSEETVRDAIDLLLSCQLKSGGFGGGPGQLPHLATTYAAVAALVTLGREDVLALIDRESLFSFLLRMCVPPERGGGMTMHQDGEVDVRGCYCALSVCHMLYMDTKKIADACDLVRFVHRCQSHEGGIGGEPGNEAHGGYTFCAYGALELAQEGNKINKALLKSWVSRMQGRTEGGMKGRTNKLVDGCYSWWQGGLCRLAHVQDDIWNATRHNEIFKFTPNFSQCDQIVADAVDQWSSSKWQSPGQIIEEASAAKQQELEMAMDMLLEIDDELENNPEKQKNRQYEEQEKVIKLQSEVDRMDEQLPLVQVTQKCLEKVRNGSNETDVCDFDALQLWILLCCQINGRGGLRDKPGKSADFYHTCYCLSGLSAAQHAGGNIIGGKRNLLLPTHPVCNVVIEKLDLARKHFGAQS